MKQGIHPNYHEATVVCACGATFKTGTTKDTDIIKVEICNKCHPYFTGKQKLVDAGGRVERQQIRQGAWCILPYILICSVFQSQQVVGCHSEKCCQSCNISRFGFVYAAFPKRDCTSTYADFGS